MHGDGERLFGVLLTDHILIEEILDLTGAGDGAEKGLTGGQLSFFLTDDVVGEIDAVGADVDVVWSFNHWADISGRFAAEAAGGDATAAEATTL
jgi:hypothetical protein